MARASFHLAGSKVLKGKPGPQGRHPRICALCLLEPGDPLDNISGNPAPALTCQNLHPPEKLELSGNYVGGLQDGSLSSVGPAALLLMLLAGQRCDHIRRGQAQQGKGHLQRGKRLSIATTSCLLRLPYFLAFALPFSPSLSAHQANAGARPRASARRPAVSSHMPAMSASPPVPSTHPTSRTSSSGSSRPGRTPSARP